MGNYGKVHPYVFSLALVFLAISNSLYDRAAYRTKRSVPVRHFFCGCRLYIQKQKHTRTCIHKNISRNERRRNPLDSIRQLRSNVCQACAPASRDSSCSAHLRGEGPKARCMPRVQRSAWQLPATLNLTPPAHTDDGALCQRRRAKDGVPSSRPLRRRI